MATALAAIGAAASLRAADAPNLILVYADDLGYADTSVRMMDGDPSTRHDFIRTPGLERLAQIGTTFSAAYAPTPTCTGSRLSLQFGKTPARLHCRSVFDVLSRYQRPDGWDDEVTIAEMLKASGRGYVSAMFGKGCSVMGRFDEAGYDVTDERPGEPGGNGNGHGSYWDPKRKTPFPADDPKRLHSLRRRSVAFVNEHAGKRPFFLMVSHYAPHIPHMATKEAIERTRKRWIAAGRDTEKIDSEKSPVNREIVYAAMVEEMDRTVVDLLTALADKDERDNTYFVFTSDNGGGHSRKEKIDGATYRFNGPLREGKRSIFEGGIRVPTVIAGPGIAAGSQCDVPIVQWDFLPTFHDLSGSEVPLPKNVDGGSLRDVLEHGNDGNVKRAAPGIVHHYPCHFHPPISAIRIGDYKLMRHLNTGETRLFNVRTDYREQHDLSERMPERVAAMDAVRRKYVEEVDGGTADRVRQALFDTMDEFSRRSREAYRRDLARRVEENPADLPERRAALLAELNGRLLKNEINKEKARRHASLESWYDGPSSDEAEEAVRKRWMDVVD